MYLHSIYCFIKRPRTASDLESLQCLYILDATSPPAPSNETTRLRQMYEIK